jgi:hypothetical protein
MTDIPHPTRRKGVATALFAGLALTACASATGERIYNAHYFSYTPSNFRSMAAAGAPIEIYGAPPGGATPEEVVAAIEMPRHLSQTAPVVAEVPGQGQRLVFAFGASGAVDGAALCGGATQGGELTDRLEVQGAYCRGERLLTQAQMTADRPLGPPDPDFTQAMRRLIETLGPRDDPNRDSRERMILRR